jgi:hypothetical protein
MCYGRPSGVAVAVGPHRLSPSGVPLPPPRRVSAVPRLLPLTPLLPWPHVSPRRTDAVDGQRSRDHIITYRISACALHGAWGTARLLLKGHTAAGCGRPTTLRTRVTKAARTLWQPIIGMSHMRKRRLL